MQTRSCSFGRFSLVSEGLALVCLQDVERMLSRLRSMILYDAWVPAMCHAAAFPSCMMYEPCFCFLAVSAMSKSSAEKLEDIQNGAAKADDAHLPANGSHSPNKFDTIESQQDFSDIDEKKLLRKIDWNIVPFLTFLYLLSFLDRTAIGLPLTRPLSLFTSLQGMLDYMAYSAFRDSYYN
jgi:hypothetical protein